MKKCIHEALSISLMTTLCCPWLVACNDADNSMASLENADRTLVIEVGAASTGLMKKDETATDTETETDDAEGDPVKKQVIQQCRGVFTGTVEGWKVAGSENKLGLTPTQAIAVRLTGSQNSLSLVIKAKEGETAPVTFPGICLVLAGNQPHVQATLNGVSLEHFKVVGHGNGGTVDIELQSGSILPEGATEDLGKHVTVTVKDASATVP
nr:Unknown Function [uncultured bacterium]